MTRHPFIVIEGVIGVGKTTLARLLRPAFDGYVITEVFEENPFLSDFYTDRARYAFQTQLFFLLNRYRQQVSEVSTAVKQQPVIADYMFAKDRLFALINLTGDEFSIYERVYQALGEQMYKPDLLVYLKADLDVLMRRIATRDRPYERDMESGYIEQLRLAYEDFITNYNDIPLLIIDTNNLDFVKHKEDFDLIKERILSQLEYGTYQASLPGVEQPVATQEPKTILARLQEQPRQLTDFQAFHLSLDAEKGFHSDPFMNFIGLNEEVGELAHVFKLIWNMQNQLQAEGKSQPDSQRESITKHRVALQGELADCLAYLLKLSNYAGINLEQAYLEKMALNADRRWENGRLLDD